MKNQDFKKNSYRILIFCVFLKALCATAHGARLPVKMYTAADGLANDQVNRIVSDSRGFLWFCTGEGLSRFDGYVFKNYTQEEGLPHRNVNDLVELGDGTRLIATSGGAAVFNPRGRPFRWNSIEGKSEQNAAEEALFQTYIPIDSTGKNKSKSVLSLAVRGDGTIYAATSFGLFQFLKAGNQWQFQKIEFSGWEGTVLHQLLTDSQKFIWVAASEGIFRISPNGNIEKISDVGGNSIFEDRSGKIWIDSGGSALGLRVFEPNADGQVALKKIYSTKDGLLVNPFSKALAQLPDGRIFVSSKGILMQFLPDAKENEPQFTVLENELTNTAAIDKNGNLWLDMIGKGAMKYMPRGFESFDSRDGLSGEPITSIFGNLNGEVFLNAGKEKILKAANDKIESLIPFGAPVRSWSRTLLDFQAMNGEWWLGSIHGLRRYPKLESFSDLAKTPPKKIYTIADGLPGDEIFNSFEDSRGDVWFSVVHPETVFMRWERATEKFYRYTAEDNLPERSGAVGFAEDKQGNIWISFYFGQLARYKNGVFQQFAVTTADSVINISEIFSDTKNRLWVTTTSRGLFRTENPDAENPIFTNFSAADGISSNQTLCVTEDRFGKIYIGTGRGINRLEPESGRVKIYTQADGLPGNIISQCYTDANGVLWFSSNDSLIRFKPEAEQTAVPLPVTYIDSLSVNGLAKPVSELGETTIEKLELESDERQLQIGFFAFSFDTGETLRYQYRLGDADWSAPNAQRTVDFANLGAGDYKFAVRAVNADGLGSENPATISFTIAPPIYLRRWFIAAAMTILGLAIFSLDRFRRSQTSRVKAALKRTQESETRFRTLAETASDAIITIDADSRIRFVNPAIEKIFGYPPDEILGEKLTVLMLETFQPQHDGGLKRYLTTGRRNISWAGIEVTGKHKSGAEIPLEISFGEFERDGERYFTGIIRDISDRKQAEDALRKSREERLRELQKVRTRIATDLHDDIGSSLTQIAVLTEVARGQAASFESSSLLKPLERIKSVSKDLVEAMSDVVWAINPAKDNLPDLLQRMRRFASDVCAGRGIRFELIAERIEEEFQLGANIRREIFAIFKESVNNAVKYSDCARINALFEIKNDALILKINDDGKGFDTNFILSADFSPDRGGNGLLNMRRRARELGGECEINSSDSGTTIKIKIPVHSDSDALTRIGGANGNGDCL